MRLDVLRWNAPEAPDEETLRRELLDEGFEVFRWRDKPAADMKGVVEPTIAVNKDYCILCGACVNACPGEDIIVMQRTSVRMKGTETDLFKQIREKLFTKRTSKVKEDVTGQVSLKVMEKA